VIVAGTNNLIQSSVLNGFIGSGQANSVSSSAGWTVLVGGSNNIIQENARGAFIGSGFSNRINSNSVGAIIVGGLRNVASGNYAAIVGGTANSSASSYSLVISGQSNSVSGIYSGIVSGLANSVSSPYSGVLSGRGNSVIGNGYSVIFGGQSNAISGQAGYAAIMGGFNNAASGSYAAVLGGRDNSAVADYSFAAGRRAKSTNTGTFIFADSQNADFASTTNNQFLIRAAGGVGINTNNPGTNALSVRGRTQIDGDLQVTGQILGNVNASNATFSSLTVNTLTSSNGAIILQPGGTTGLTLTPQTNVTISVTNNDNPSNPVITTYTGTAHNIIGGFSGNSVAPGLVGATIAGGGRLVISTAGSPSVTNSNSVLAHFGTIGGGSGNTASGFFSTIAGGLKNTASGQSSFIGGGEGNLASGLGSGISFGAYNQANAEDSAVFSGYNNRSEADATLVGAGANNRASSSGAIVVGGFNNHASGSESVVGGGATNWAGGSNSVVPGGLNNEASGTGSFAAGVNAKATNDYSFVWGGSPEVNTVSVADSSFTVNAPGGSRFVTGTNSSGGSIGVTLAANATSWDSLSDSNAKTAVTPIDHRETLRKVAALPVTAWNYKHDPKRRYIGPMAQDFHAAFGLGYDDKHISTLDTDGVTLSAIKGLVEEIRDQDHALAERERQIEALETQVKLLRQETGL
jgi:hypothetical protein